MRYWKRINATGKIASVESYSHNLDVKGAEKITKEEYDEFIASLPVVEPEPVRDYGKEIDAINERLKVVEKK